MAALTPPPPPVEAHITTDVDEVPAGDPFVVDATRSSSVDSLEWSLDGETYTTYQETVSLDRPGEYTIELIAYGPDGPDTDVTTITVVEPTIDQVVFEVNETVLDVGDSTALNLTAYYTDGSTGPVPAGLTVRSSDEDRAVVENGMVVATGVGTVDIEVVYRDEATSETILIGEPDDEAVDDEADGDEEVPDDDLAPAVPVALLALAVVLVLGSRRESLYG